MRTLLTIICLLIAAPAFAYGSRAPWGTGESKGEDLSVSLVTFGPGDDIPSWFGHTALVVEDHRLGVSRLYNYGMFDFEKFARFALGRLEFWVGEQAPPEAVYRLYKELDRDVRVQELNLSPVERLQIAKALADNVLPQNREYLYHHYLNNCATKPRDMIDAAIGGQLHKANSVPARMTLRGHTRRHSAVMPPMSVLLDFLMNDEIDQPIERWAEAFLPAELASQVGEMKYVNDSGQTVPLVAKEWVYFDSDRPNVPETPPNYLPWLLLIGAATGASGFFLQRASDKRWGRILFGFWNVLIGFVIGLPGLVLMLMWIITNHTVTFHNENLFLANPITFLALPFGFMWMSNSPRARKWLPRIWLSLACTGLLGLLLKALPWFDQDNWRLFALILPISLGAAAAFALELQSKKARALAPRVAV
ncbi:MAG: DUF4105 domain-containing protein [Myxococcaceae bacterium]